MQRHSMHWKIATDPYYSEIYRRDGMDAVVRAGFFMDEGLEPYNVAESLDIMCTPVAFMREAISQPNPCVLVATGCFAPLHDGHVDMMRLAKVRAEEAGYSVIGGFMAPDHDSYVRTKPGGIYYDINYRLGCLRRAIKDIDWLRVDPWMGVYRKYAVNFTEQVWRIERYIERHLGAKIPIFLVVGADNAPLANTFKYHGNCIIVERAWYPIEAVEQQDPAAAGRILLAPCGNTSHYNSTDIRAANPQGPQYLSLPTQLLLRMESKDATHLALYRELKKRFASVKISLVDAQRNRFARRSHTYPIISLDPMIRGDYNIGISRNYDFGGTDMLGYTARPGSGPLCEQIEAIPPGKYVLYDDDIHTGNTIAYTREFLVPHNIEISAVWSFTRSTPDQEVIDCRDFIYGAPHGGLVVDNERVPYLYPFVDPVARASIPDPLEFSRAIWDINIAQHSPDSQPYAQCRKHRDIIA